MKIFLTGGTGFVGSHFINEAHKVGHEVIALKRIDSNTRVTLNRDPSWIEGTLDGDYHGVLVGCDAFVHLAAYGVSPQPANWNDCLYWNVLKSVDLLNQALISGVKRVICVGTFSEYGEASLQYEFIPPTCSLSPKGAYATSKVAFSAVMNTLCKEYNVYASYFRLFSIFGDGQHENNLYPSLMKAALLGEDFSMTKGEQIRDFLSVDVAAKQIVEGLEFNNVGLGSTSFSNIGSGRPQSILEFSEYYWNRWNAKGRLNVGSLPYRTNEIMRYVAQI
jgi:UDP-glucose 4-epimerase